jgi:RNA polymerase sigma-70 factor (ECF subfamily)
MADSVGLALLVVLQTLPPPERIAFVLHDMFDMPFDDIAPIVKRTPVATRQLASRARRRVRGADKDIEPDIAEHKRVIDAFLAASQKGDFEGLMALLDPDVVGRADPTAARMGGLTEVRGAETVAGYFRGRAQAARSALVDGAVGVVVAPSGRLMLVLNVTIANGKITLIDAVADPERLKKMELSAF